MQTTLKPRLSSSLIALGLLGVGTVLGTALWRTPVFAQGTLSGTAQALQPVSVGGSAGNSSAAVVAYGNGVVALVWPAGIRTYRVDTNGKIVKLDARDIDPRTGDLTAPSAVAAKAPRPTPPATPDGVRPRIYSFGPGWQALNNVVNDRGGYLSSYNYTTEHYGQSLGRSAANPSVILLYALDSPDRPDPKTMPYFAQHFPRPIADVEAVLKEGKTLEMAGQAGGANVVLLAAPTTERLSQLIGETQLLDKNGFFTP